jgi:hypothetical protein
MTNQLYHRELFLQYSHLIRLLQVVDLIEEVLAILVENQELEAEVERKDARRLAGIILHAGLQNIASQYAPERPGDLAQSIHFQQILKQSRIPKRSPIALPVDSL